MEIKIPTDATEKFLRYMEKINNRCKKIGVPKMEYQKIRSDVFETSIGSGEFFEVSVFDVSGETPKINGWIFLGRIEHDHDLGNVIRNAPGKEIPQMYWETSGACDHCKTTRNRKDTFIIQNIETLDTKQIGRQCIRDYIGYDNPADMVWYCNIQDEIHNEIESYGNGGSYLVSVQDVLRRSMAIISQEGFTSVAKSDEFHPATSHLVQNTFTKNKNDWADDICRMSVDFADKTELIVAWVNSWNDARKKKTEFNWNVQNFVTRGLCGIQHVGFIACLPVLFDAEMNKQNETEYRSNEFVGVVGEKITITLTLRRTVVFDGAYGYSYMNLFSDDNGNDFVWTSSSNQEIDAGETVEIKATIKAHKLYNGRNQTIITRGKIL